MKKPISIGLAPNFQRQDIFLAWRLFLFPWNLGSGRSVGLLEKWFERYFRVKCAVSFISGRSALYALLHCLDIGKGDEVILQAFTCVVVPNAVLAVGATPVYVDIDKSLTMDVELLQKKITKRTKVIIVQHTFGIPAHMDEILVLAKKKKILVIEDAAHTIGGEYKGKLLGTLGIAGIFSFGRDKAFSSVFGGVAITNDSQLKKRLRTYQRQKSFPSVWWVWHQLLYILLSSFILSSYSFFRIGKGIHFILNRMKFFLMPVSTHEKKGIFDYTNIRRMPSGLALLALSQLQKIERVNQHRETLSTVYSAAIQQEHIKIRKTDMVFLLRYPLWVEDKQRVIRGLGGRDIYIGNWYTQVVDPQQVDLGRVGYVTGSCPVAENMCQHIVNLPTYQGVSRKDAQELFDVLKGYV